MKPSSLVESDALSRKPVLISISQTRMENNAKLPQSNLGANQN